GLKEHRFGGLLYFDDVVLASLVNDFILLDELRQRLDKAVVNRLRALRAAENKNHRNIGFELQIFSRTFGNRLGNVFSDRIAGPDNFFFWKKFRRFRIRNSDGLRKLPRPAIDSARLGV